jgi:hypothetical protein
MVDAIGSTPAALMSTPLTERRITLCLALLLAVAFALRVVAALVLPDQSAVLADSVAYREAGHLLWTTGQLGSPFHMPLYPALVAVLGPGWFQLLIDIGLSTATVWLVYQLASSIFGDPRVALMAAAATAIYPYLIFYSVVGLTETLFIALIIAAYVCWYRGMNAAAAVCSALAILTRPIFDPVAPILAAYFALFIQRQSVAAAIRSLLIYAAVYCIIMSPWWLHNYKAYGQFVRLNLGGGLALLSGNNPSNQSGGIDTKLGASLAQFSNIANPVERDKAMRDAAWTYIKSDPRHFLQQAVRKFERFWLPWPHAENYRSGLYFALATLSFLPVLVMAGVFVIWRGYANFRRIMPLALFIGYLTAIHMVFPGSIRYRLPLEPFLIVLAAAGTVELLTRWRKNNLQAASRQIAD